MTRLAESDPRWSLGTTARPAVDQRSLVRELISMWVALEARHQGIGARLIESVAAWAAAAGASALVLDVVAANAPAIALYGHAGFQLSEDASLGKPAPNEIRLVRRLVG